MKRKLAIFVLMGMMAISFSACSQNNNAEAKITELETEIQKLNDVNEIKMLQEQFANLADQKNAAAQMDLFTENAQVILNIEGQQMTLDGAEQIEEAFANTLNNTDILYHMNGQGTIEVNGDIATGIAYCRVVLIDTEDGITTHTDEGVRYTDEYIRQNGKWLISKRISDFMFVDRETTQAQ